LQLVGGKLVFDFGFYTFSTRRTYLSFNCLANCRLAVDIWINANQKPRIEK